MSKRSRRRRRQARAGKRRFRPCRACGRWRPCACTPPRGRSAFSAIFDDLQHLDAFFEAALSRSEIVYRTPTSEQIVEAIELDARDGSGLLVLDFSTEGLLRKRQAKP